MPTNPPRKAKLSRLQKPDNLSLEDWQVELRRHFGREQKFRLRNLGDDPVFSEFAVNNPESGNTYRVTVRGAAVGDNACTCGDFATNTLGTCKHIEFVLGVLERRRNGAKALRNGYAPPQSEVYLHYGARREVRFRAGNDCPPELERLAADALTGDFADFDSFLSRAAELEPDLRVQDDVLAFVAEVRDTERRAAKLVELFPRGIRSAAWKNLLNVDLYDYQREGTLFAVKAGRCLIGDEMGLGKTVQAIAAAEIYARHFGVGRVLIVCPTSLKHQWQSEIERFTGRDVVVVNGMAPARRVAFERESFFKVINYDTVYRDLPLIEAWSPDLVVLDEAQRIKNWQTRTARSVKKIAAPYAVVLTGTPLENRLEELVSIVQFVDRFRLGPTFRLLDAHQVRDSFGKVVGYRDLDKLGQSLAPILVRRQKAQVLGQLPERVDQHLVVAMTPRQRDLHEENREIVARIVQKWRKYRFLSERDQRMLMIALQNMRMSCDSSYLLDPVADHGVKADELMTLLGEMLEQPEVKVVVFSQWLRMHELLVRRLRTRGWDHVLFHGGAPGSKRKDLVERFRDDAKCRLFLSTDAGGVGLNLQWASAVINVDLPWNPAVLEQRIGRVHRLGQKRAVRVVNFVAQGTIEEGMMSLLNFKRGLFAGVLDGGATEVSLGGSRLTRFMETVEKATTSIPIELVEEPVAPERPPVPAKADDPWSMLAAAAQTLVQRLTQPSEPGRPSLIGRDEATGEPYLRLPVPTPEVLTALATWLGSAGK